MTETINKYASLLSEMANTMLYVNEHCLKVERDAVLRLYERRQAEIISACMEIGILNQVMDRTKELLCEENKLKTTTQE